MPGRQYLNISDAQIYSRNFAGKEKTYNGKLVNREGNRNFSVGIQDPELGERLIAEGWSVSRKDYEPDDGSEPYSVWYLNVAVRFDNFPPDVFIVTESGRKTKMTEATVANIDSLDLLSADLVISPSHWEVNGKSGVKAYLKAGYFVYQEDVFASKYADDEEPEEIPFI